MLNVNNLLEGCECIGTYSTAVATGMVGAAFAYWLLRRGSGSTRRLPPPIINPDGSRSSPFVKDDLIGRNFEDVKTLWEAFLRGHKQSKDHNFLGTFEPESKNYKWLTYDQVNEQIHEFASGLNHLCWSQIPQSPGTSLFVGAWMSNRPEFFVSEFASFSASNVIVPLYDTLGDDAVFHIINQTEMQVIVCDKATRIDSLFDGSGKVNNVKLIVFVGDLNSLKESTRTAATAHGIKIVPYEQVLATGRDHPISSKPPKPSDLALISYTSGTTGLPKGVMLTHENCVACVAAGVIHVEAIGVTWTSEEVHYSYLPMAHAYEQIMQFTSAIFGSAIGYSRGDPRKMFEDIAILQPTVFAAVPRILNRVYDLQVKYFSTVGFTSKLAYQLGLVYKMSLLKKGCVTYETWADKLTFYPVRKLFGGRIRLMLCGSAPVARDVLLWYRCVLGVPVFEGYGQTETTAAATGTDPFDMEAGHVGVPFVCNYVKLADVPDMNYFARDNRGEICVKGLNCSIGYFKEPEKTKELIDSDGWTHTGDIGTWQDNGNLKIVDRKKHIFKLAQGEYVAPEKIEAVYQQCSLVSQIFVDGCSLEICTVAIVIPDRDELIKLWESKGKVGDPTLSGISEKQKLFEALCLQREVRIAVLKQLNEIGKAQGLNGFEQVKNIFLSNVPFGLDNGLLTPTMKTKRPDVRKAYSSHIDKLYDEIRGVGELK